MSDGDQVITIPTTPSTATKNSTCGCGCVSQCRRRWSAEWLVYLLSNICVAIGTLAALGFSIDTLNRLKVGDDYLLFLIFILGGTVFGGACLLALVNLSWMARIPNRRWSLIQVICNIMIIGLSIYLESHFWRHDRYAYFIFFGAGVPMLVLINLPSFFVMRVRQPGDESATVCLEGDLDSDDWDEDLENGTKHGKEQVDQTTSEVEGVDVGRPMDAPAEELSDTDEEQSEDFIESSDIAEVAPEHGEGDDENKEKAVQLSAPNSDILKER